MAPPNSQKRVKGVQIYRPFIFGTTAKPFDSVKNPKPEGTPPDHTHSWTVFVKGVDNQDITYWLKKVQFKLHESIPNPLRNVEAAPGQPFEVSETGWGEFEMSIKLHYVSESNEKPQSVWHHLRLHPYGPDELRAKQIRDGEVDAWCYEEQVFNEPYEQFYDILTGGGGEAKASGKAKGGKKANQKEMDKRTATVPPRPSPGQPYARETEVSELRKLRDVQVKVDEQRKAVLEEVEKKGRYLESLKVEAQKVG